MSKYQKLPTNNLKFPNQRKLILVNLFAFFVIIILNNYFSSFEVRILNTFIDTPKDVNELENPIDRIIWFNNMEDNEFRHILPYIINIDDDFERVYRIINSHRSHYNDNTIKYFLSEIKKNSKCGTK